MKNNYIDDKALENFIAFYEIKGEISFSNQTFKNISIMSGSILFLKNVNNISIMGNIFENNFGFKGTCIYYNNEGILKKL